MPKTHREGPTPILLSVDSLLAPPLTGIGRYTLGLLTSLQNQGQRKLRGLSRSGVMSVEDIGARMVAEPGASARIATIQPKSALLNLLRDRLREVHFRRVTRSYRDHIYHETNHILRPFAGRCVTTIHDLSVLRYPDFHPKERVRYFERQLPRTLAQADMVVTDSKIVAEELRRDHALPAEKVVTVAPGLDAAFQPIPMEDRQRSLAALGLQDKRYLLSVGTMEPRKNQAGLIEAFERLPDALQERFPLILAGASGWHMEPFGNRSKTLQARGRLRTLGYVSEEKLVALYGGARGFVFPSIYEGFGFPVLEALACGTPVLTSRGTSMAEITTGGGALLANPLDVDDLSEKLRQLLEDEELTAAINPAEIRRTYSWSAHVSRLGAIYDSLGG